MSKRDDRLMRMGESYQGFKERQDRNHQFAYERKIVKKLLIGLGIPSFELRIKEPDALEEQNEYMTFSWMYQNYPNIPVQLMGYMDWEPPDLWLLFRTSVKRNSYLEKWKEIRSLLSDCGRQAIGCVFRAPLVVGGDVVFHNADLPYLSFPDPRDNVFGEAFRITETGEQIHIELLDVFIKRLKLVWEPI